jgi:hypothetical protein
MHHYIVIYLINYLFGERIVIVYFIYLPGERSRGSGIVGGQV